MAMTAWIVGYAAGFFLMFGLFLGDAPKATQEYPLATLVLSALWPAVALVLIGEFFGALYRKKES
jgi:hypothetical protein